jgi:asparagine synthase (glutamine-hydrolysing)
MEKVFEEMDEPYWFPNLFWIRAICQSAGQAKVRVLLDGFDGDTVISHGLFLLEETFRSFRWGRLLAEISCLQKTLKIPAQNLIWSRCIAPLAPDWFARIWKRIRKHTAYDYAKSNFNPHFAEKIGLRSCLQAKYESHADSSENELLQALEDGFLQYIMEAENHIAAAFSLEYSHPFFDKRVVEFRRGYSRWIMREALKGILPEKIRMRGDKANLSSNFDQRLISGDGYILRSLAASYHHDVWRYASYSQFRNMYEQIGSDTSKLNTLSMWAMANLALWLEYIQIKIILKI